MTANATQNALAFASPTETAKSIVLSQSALGTYGRVPKKDEAITVEATLEPERPVGLISFLMSTFAIGLLALSLVFFVKGGSL